MQSINELEIRRLLKSKLRPPELVDKVVARLSDISLSWEERRPYWHFLFHLGQHRVLYRELARALRAKDRIPFDLFIELTSDLSPASSVREALLKGIKKQAAIEELIAAKSWDKWDRRFFELRAELVERRAREISRMKDELKEKFSFLRNQRMVDEAGRVLRRMLELYPDEVEFQQYKHEFDEQWAREVLSTHMANLSLEKIDKTSTAPSSVDEEMLKMFLLEGEKIAIENREFALDMAVAFWFMDEPQRGLEILAWAAPTRASDWLRGELLFAARRFVEALEHLNQLEIKYIEDPETIFATTYLRAQCLFYLGQTSTALEILQSIARVRPQYRSTHALILEWTQGRRWD